MVTGEASSASRVFVAGVLVTGMTLVVLAISAQWLAGLRKAAPEYHRWAAPLVRSLLVVVGVVACIALVNGTNLAGKNQDRNQRERIIAKAKKEFKIISQENQSLIKEEGRIIERWGRAIRGGHYAVGKELEGEIEILEMRIELNEKWEERLTREEGEAASEAQNELAH